MAFLALPTRSSGLTFQTGITANISPSGRASLNLHVLTVPREYHRAQCLAPLLFTCYISPISSVASSFDASIQQYADDTQIYIALTTADVTAHLNRLSSCLSVLHKWFCHNGIALNSSKSESILFGTRQRLRNFPSVSTPTKSGSQIPFSDNIKTLGVTLDANLTLNQHVSSLCKSMHFYRPCYKRGSEAQDWAATSHLYHRSKAGWRFGLVVTRWLRST